PADSESKHRQRRLVPGHSVVAKVSTHNRPQPLALRKSEKVERLRLPPSTPLPLVDRTRTELEKSRFLKATAVLGGPGISRFPFEVLPYVHGVCDRAGLRCTSR